MRFDHSTSTSIEISSQITPNSLDRFRTVEANGLMTDLSVKTTELHGWLDRIKAGDPDALNNLFTRIASRLERLAKKMLLRFPRVARWAQADDVMQNASLRLIRALEDIRPASMREFYGLASTQIRRELLDMTKSLYGPQGDAAHHLSFDPNDSDARRKLEPANPQDDRELERWCSFHEEVENLPGDEREVVGLIFYHGWKQDEVATMLGVHLRTVQRWWKSALKRLQHVLSDWPVCD
jgi:RNA polymerase sigma factor (sigma-70 family)